MFIPVCAIFSRWWCDGGFQWLEILGQTEPFFLFFTFFVCDSFFTSSRSIRERAVLAEKRWCLEAVYLSLRKNVQDAGGKSGLDCIFLIYFIHNCFHWVFFFFLIYWLCAWLLVFPAANWGRKTWMTCNALCQLSFLLF